MLCQSGIFRNGAKYTHLMLVLLRIVVTVFCEDDIEQGENVNFNQEDIKKIVDYQNSFRSQNITPTASNMREITWDDSLAKFSGEWTKYCKYTVKENTTTDQWVAVGQSFFLAASPWTIDFHYSAALSWLEQSNFYTFENSSCSDFCGHYVQLAYSESYKIGCSATFCPVALITGSGQRIPDATFYMCSYLPYANIGETKPYTAGTACTNCTDSTDTCTDEGLCSNPARDKPIPVPNRGIFSFAESWTKMQKIIAASSSGVAVLGIVGAIFKLFKGGSVQPSASGGGHENGTDRKPRTEPAGSEETS